MKHFLHMWLYPRMVSWFLVTFLLVLAVRLPFARLSILPFHVDLFPGVVLVPLVGVFWGPAGALGLMAGVAAGDWIMGLWGPLTFYRSVGYLLFALTAKRLWETSLCPETHLPGYTPCWSKTTQFLYVSLPGAVLAATWTAWGAEVHRLYPFAYVLVLCLLNHLVFGLLLGPALYRIMAREMVPHFGTWREVMGRHGHLLPICSKGATLLLTGIVGAPVAGYLASGMLHGLWPDRAFWLGTVSGPWTTGLVVPFLVLQVVGIFYGYRCVTPPVAAAGILMLLVGVSPSLAGNAPEPSLAMQEPRPSGDELLQRVVDSLPRTPLVLEAKLSTPEPKTEDPRVVLMDVDLDWRSDGGSAAYRLRDTFGSDRERMEVRFHSGSPPEFAYFPPGTTNAVARPDLYLPIEGTVFCWTDLTLAFLWWQGGTTVGVDEVKGRTCWVVDLIAPPGAPDHYAGVRVWVEPKMNALLKAEVFSRESGAVKRVSIKSFRKIKELWMIKDLDVRDLATGQRTRMRVTDLRKQGEDADRDEWLEED